MSALEIVYCFAVIVFAYALRGGTGFGAVLVMPLLALVIPMKALVPVWSILSVVAGASILRHDYRHIAWADFLLLMPTCLLGVAFGLLLLQDVRTRRRSHAGSARWWCFTAHCHCAPRGGLRPSCTCLVSPSPGSWD